MEKRIGVLGIIVEDMSATTQLNAILHNYADVIIGRLGVPYREKNINVISIIIEGTAEQINALSDKLNEIQGVNVTSNLSKMC
ncbi:MAG: CopG family transcriptional regulator [Clostridiaceae bacterium]|jgi:putative iron-only hydrogenase system regulator|nr:CopG family transcriptional regulator [Clostridiaceae bacterium]